MMKFGTLTGDFFANQCWSPRGQPAIATVYFISFIVVASFIIFSLFIGAVCGGMSESLEHFEEEDRRAKETEAARVAALADPK